MVFCFWHYVKTRQLIVSETSSSFVTMFGRLAADPAIAGVEEVAHRALSVDVGVLTNKVYNSLSFEVHLAGVQFSADYWLTLLVW